MKLLFSPPSGRQKGGGAPADGFTLLEVLVSLLVLSLGLLGIAALQAATTSYKMNTWARSSTAILVSDLAERVRANPLASDPDTGIDPGTASYEQGNAAYSTSEPSQGLAKDCRAGSCTPAERAKFDLWQWRKSVSSLLPTGNAWVEGDRKKGYRVTLMWADKDKACDPKCPTLSGSSAAAEASKCPPAANVTAQPFGVRCQIFSFIP